MRLHWPLINLAMLFLLPVIAALYMLTNNHYKNAHSAQHGIIIQPARAITFENLEYIVSNETQKWLLVYVQPPLCDLACQQEKHTLLKLHTALGAERKRVTIAATTDTLSQSITTNSLLIVNPQGLYIMQYSAKDDHSGLLKDLRRLLKYSHA